MAYDNSTKDEPKGDTIISEAMERFEDSQDGSDYNRITAEEDIRFSRLADQWPDKIKQQREAEGRPCLTINRLPAFVRQVVNDARQNKPGIVVAPVDNGADVDKADVISGIIRSVERNSNADVAYDTAMDNAVSGGFGFFRLAIDYAHDESFEMEARIERIANPLSVHWDTNSTEFDASDWEYAFVGDSLTDDQFKLKYPGAKPVSFDGDDQSWVQYWLDNENVRVSEYWLRSEITRKLLLLSNGQTILEDDLTEEIRAFNMVSQISVIKDREVKSHTVKRRIISGVEVLEETDWPGSMIPVCPVWGEEVVLDGRRYFRSMIRDARDPQNMFNFWRSASTELVALAPRAPFIVEEGSIPAGPEGKKWATANTRSHQYLLHKKGSQPPQRQPFAGIPAGALQEALNASDDMKAIMGIHDASLGAQGNETSGKAILARQRESDVSNFHFVDNLNRAIQYCARCLVEIIPSVYSDRETLRILGEDMKEKIIRLGEQDGKDDQGKLYDITTGKYDVTVKAGPSYASQREETRETLIEIMRSVPDSAKFIGDILLEHMDFQGAEKVAKRLKSLLPPEVQKMEMEDGQDDMPPEAKQAIGQMEGFVKQLQQDLQVTQQEYQKLLAEKEAEDGKREVEHGKNQNEHYKLQIEEKKLGLENATATMTADHEADKAQMEQTNLAMEQENMRQLDEMTGAIQTLAEGIAQSTVVNQQQLGVLADGQKQLMEAYLMPKRVVRDEQGRAAGIEPAMEVEGAE